MSQTFKCNQFQLALATTNKIKTALQPFLLEFQKNNIPWIFAAITELTQYLTNTKIQPNLAFNSLIAVKFILDRANILMTHMVEIYLLPTILQIASYRLQSGEELRGHSYFISKGYKGDKDNLESIGYHFVRIACEIIMTVSQIKPKVVCFNEQLQVSSEFQLAFQKMKRMGLQSYKSFMFYEHSIIKQARERFIKNLELYSKDILPFKDYCEVFIRSYLAKGQQPVDSISPFKLLEKGQATAIDIVVRECLRNLLSSNLSERTRALKLMSDLIRWGDITVAYMINSEGPLNELVKEIGVSKQKRLGKQRSLTLFDKYQNSDQEKEQYYYQLLRSLQLWGKCYPTAINSIDKISNVKCLCGQLQKEGVQFPDYEQIFADQALFQSNRRKKIRINEKLFNYMQSMQGERKVSTVNIYIQEACSFIYENKTPFEVFSEEIQTVYETLSKMCESENKIDEYIQILSKFCRDFDVNIEKGQFNNADLQFIINQGVPLIQRAEKIMPYLEQYKEKSIHFDALRTMLLEYNKQMTITQVYNSYRESKFLESTNLQDVAGQNLNMNPNAVSYRLDLLPMPRIDLTQSHELTMQQILKQKYKSKIAVPSKASNPLTKKPTTGPTGADELLFNFSVDNLMQSRQVVKKMPPNCLKLIKKLQSLSMQQDFQWGACKFQQSKRSSRVF